MNLLSIYQPLVWSNRWKTFREETLNLQIVSKFSLYFLKQNKSQEMILKALIWIFQKKINNMNSFVVLVWLIGHKYNLWIMNLGSIIESQIRQKFLNRKMNNSRINWTKQRNKWSVKQSRISLIYKTNSYNKRPNLKHKLDSWNP